MLQSQISKSKAAVAAEPTSEHVEEIERDNELLNELLERTEADHQKDHDLVREKNGIIVALNKEVEGLKELAALVGPEARGKLEALTREKTAAEKRADMLEVRREGGGGWVEFRVL